MRVETFHRLFKMFATVIVCCLAASQVYADQVTDWNVNADKARIAACLGPDRNPLQISRMYAIMHLAIHDALNAIERRSRPYVFDRPTVRWASTDAAVSAAARDVLVVLISQIQGLTPECIAAGVARVESDYAAALASIPDDPARTKGIETGSAAAKVMLDLRLGDGSELPIRISDYPQGTEPGEYRFTDGQTIAFGVYWGGVKPFVLNTPLQFRPGSPHNLSSRNYLTDFNEVKAFGGDGVTTPSLRNNEQTEIALFWLENVTPQWNRIAQTVSASRALDLWENARLFALLNVAIADAFIGSWYVKFHHNFWRPETAIRAAGADGNPDTVADPTWKPLVPTPPHPDYDSGHSIGGGAAAEVLRSFFKEDSLSFRLCSLTLPGESACTGSSPVYRDYGSFTQAQDENGLSRILVGFHFRHAVEGGIQHGHGIGNFTVKRILQPVH